MKRFKSFYVPIMFFLLSLLLMYVSEISMSFISAQIYARFIRNTIFALALIIPILAGMGINFAISIGAMAAQIAMIIVIDLKLPGEQGFLIALVLAVILATVFGNLIGFLLNKAKGKEMIASIVIGFLGTNLYQLLFMVGYGTVITPFSESILLTRGIGVKSMLDSVHLKALFDGRLMVQIGDTEASLIPFVIVLLVAAFVYFVKQTKVGYHMKAVGDNRETAEKLGVDVDKTRRLAITISTVLAALAQLMFVQDMGVLNVYTGHLKLEIFAAAALLAGGATFKKATIVNAIIGIILFHTLFLLSPIAGQNMFKNPALGEYFRSFIAYGTIVFALMMNLKYENENKLSL